MIPRRQEHGSYGWIELHFIEYQTNSNIIFRTSNELERVHLLVIELGHLNFGFKGTDIEH